MIGCARGSREIQIDNGGGQNMEPEWSPDGQWIAFHSRARDGIWIAASTGGVARQIAEFGSEPSWSPDGERLGFTSDTGGMAAQSVLWVIRKDGTDRRQLTKLGSPPGGHVMPSWSHDGRYVVFAKASGGASSELWVVA